MRDLFDARTLDGWEYDDGDDIGLCIVRTVTMSTSGKQGALVHRFNCDLVPLPCGDALELR